MSLKLDIKVPDLGDWAKNSEAIAESTERISDAEKKANKEADKSSKQSKAMGTSIKKALGDHKKTTDEEKKQKKTVVDLAASWYLIKDVARGAYDAVAGMGHELLATGLALQRQQHVSDFSHAFLAVGVLQGILHLFPLRDV